MREEKIVSLEDGGKTKTFRIKQMSAVKAQRWLFKFILLIGGNASMSSDGDWGSVLSAVADKPYEKVEELLGELTACVTCELDNGNALAPLTLANADSYIDDMDTLMTLQKESFTLNNFFGGKGMTGFGQSPSPTIPTIKRQK